MTDELRHLRQELLSLRVRLYMLGLLPSWVPGDDEAVLSRLVNWEDQ